MKNNDLTADEKSDQELDKTLNNIISVKDKTSSFEKQKHTELELKKLDQLEDEPETTQVNLDNSEESSDENSNNSNKTLIISLVCIGIVSVLYTLHKHKASTHE